MLKTLSSIVSLVLVPCLIADPSLAVALSHQQSASSVASFGFSSSALAPEPAISEGKVMYSLGQAGSLHGFRDRVSVLIHRLPHRTPKKSIAIEPVDAFASNFRQSIKDDAHEHRRKAIFVRYAGLHLTLSASIILAIFGSTFQAKSQQSLPPPHSSVQTPTQLEPYPLPTWNGTQPRIAFEQNLRRWFGAAQDDDQESFKADMEWASRQAEELEDPEWSAYMKKWALETHAIIVSERNHGPESDRKRFDDLMTALNVNFLLRRGWAFMPDIPRVIFRIRGQQPITVTLSDGSIHRLTAYRGYFVNVSGEIRRDLRGEVDWRNTFILLNDAPDEYTSGKSADPLEPEPLKHEVQHMAEHRDFSSHYSDEALLQTERVAHLDAVRPIRVIVNGVPIPDRSAQDIDIYLRETREEMKNVQDDIQSKAFEDAKSDEADAKHLPGAAALADVLNEKLIAKRIRNLRQNPADSIAALDQLAVRLKRLSPSELDQIVKKAEIPFINELHGLQVLEIRYDTTQFKRLVIPPIPKSHPNNPKKSRLIGRSA